MSSQDDVFTQRPRTPNNPYTFMSEEQIRNIKKNAAPFFMSPSAVNWPPSQGLPREGGRYYRDRYCHHSGSANLLYVGDQIRPNDVPVAYNCSRGLASAKWGLQKTGERTRSHFFGEQVENFTTIDMYRRPATTYTGRVVMDCGRPGDGYYAQRFPDRTTWNRSTAKLNCTNVMESVYRKVSSDYDRIREAEQTAREYRKGKWPEFSEYTDRYLLRSKQPPRLSQLELSKKHAAFGQQLQAAENALAQAETQELVRQCAPQLGRPRDPLVVAA